MDQDDKKPSCGKVVKTAISIAAIAYAKAGQVSDAIDVVELPGKLVEYAKPAAEYTQIAWRGVNEVTRDVSVVNVLKFGQPLSQEPSPLNLPHVVRLTAVTNTTTPEFHSFGIYGMS